MGRSIKFAGTIGNSSTQVVVHGGLVIEDVWSSNVLLRLVVK